MAMVLARRRLSWLTRMLSQTLAVFDMERVRGDYSDNSSSDRWRAVNRETRLMNPLKSISGVISMPLLSRTFVISKIIRIVAIARKIEFSAKCMPGHILIAVKSSGLRLEIGQCANEPSSKAKRQRRRIRVMNRSFFWRQKPLRSKSIRISEIALVV